MEHTKKIFLGIAGIVAVMPGILYFTESSLIPEIGIIKVLMLTIAELLCFVIIGAVILNKKKIRKLKRKTFNRLLIISLLLSITSLTSYALFLQSVKIVGSRPGHVLIEPLWHSDMVKGKIETFGSISDWKQDEGILALQRAFEKDSESMSGILSSQIVLIALYCLGISLFLIPIMLITQRIKEGSIFLEESTIPHD